MEDQIFEIIDKHYYHKDAASNAAKEITSHVVEFIEWFHEYCGKTNYLQIDDEPRKYISLTGSIYKSIEELYNLWITKYREQ